MVLSKPTKTFLLVGVVLGFSTHCRYGSDYQPYMRSALSNTSPKCSLIVSIREPLQSWDFSLREGQEILFRTQKGLQGEKNYQVAGSSEMGYVQLSYQQKSGIFGNRVLIEGETFRNTMTLDKAVCH